MRLLVLAVVLLAPGFAWGQEPAKQCVPGKPGQCVQPMTAGEPTPFDGQLYTPELAIDQSEKVHSFDARLKLELDRVNDRHRFIVIKEQRLREIEREAYDRSEKLLLQRLEDSQPPFYERPAFVIPVTIAVTAAVIFGAMALSAELGKAVWAQ